MYLKPMRPICEKGRSGSPGREGERSKQILQQPKEPKAIPWYWRSTKWVPRFGPKELQHQLGVGDWKLHCKKRLYPGSTVNTIRTQVFSLIGRVGYQVRRVGKDISFLNLFSFFFVKAYSCLESTSQYSLFTCSSFLNIFIFLTLATRSKKCLCYTILSSSSL